jgi:hypothetical protein
MRPGRQAAVFALLFALAASVVSATPRLVDRAAVQHSTLSAPALLSHVWGFLTSLWEAEGARLDPWGSPAPTSDEGARIDPLGSSAPTADAGARIDPLG